MRSTGEKLIGDLSQRIRALRWAFTWAAVFTLLHGYWYFGGRVGLGDAPNVLPGAPNSPGEWIFTIIVVLMFTVGLAAPVALLRGTLLHEKRLGVLARLLVACLWTGCVILLARGGSGLLDDAVRGFGLSSGGITGLSYQDTLGTAHPSTYTLICSDFIDSYFLLGGILYGAAARYCRIRR